MRELVDNRDLAVVAAGPTATGLEAARCVSR